MRRTVYTLILFFCWGLQGLSAQEDSTKTSTTTDDIMREIWRDTFKPYVEGNWGYTQPKHHDFNNDPAKTGMVEFRLGYAELLEHYSFVQSLDERFIFGGKTSQDFNYVESDPSGTQVDFTRFGVGTRMGYGYRIGSGLSLVPYYQAHYVWSDLSYDSSTVITETDKEILERIQGAYRFGMAGEGGLKMVLFDQLTLYSGFEYTVVYPRFIFWEWLGSTLIITSAQGIVTMFADDIVDKSPVLGPLLYFGLRNGLSWVFYQQLKNEMNWPFVGEAPLTMETFKLGVSLGF
jgi:hypothetical protein